MLGILATLGGFGFGAISIMGAAMSDSPQASNDVMNSVAIPCLIGGFAGIAMIVGACFIRP